MKAMNKNIKIKIEQEILILRFVSRDYMNEFLDPISNEYEGILVNRIGHNFPSNYIPEDSWLNKYKKICKYVIGVYNANGVAHELLHAKYYIDENYRKKIENEWKSLTEKQRSHITHFLKSIGYSDKVIVDEYQAYRYSEPANFFGINWNR